MYYMKAFRCFMEDLEESDLKDDFQFLVFFSLLIWFDGWNYQSSTYLGFILADR